MTSKEVSFTQYEHMDYFRRYVKVDLRIFAKGLREATNDSVVISLPDLNFISTLSHLLYIVNSSHGWLFKLYFVL